jgi:hypothetical protein
VKLFRAAVFENSRSGKRRWFFGVLGRSGEFGFYFIVCGLEAMMLPLHFRVTSGLAVIREEVVGAESQIDSAIPTLQD